MGSHSYLVNLEFNKVDITPSDWINAVGHAEDRFSATSLGEILFIT